MPNGRDLNMTVEGSSGPNIQMSVQSGAGTDIQMAVSPGGNGAAATAEAYAVGTRGGVAVGSDDPAYNNYAKYWAQQAAASATDTSKYPQIVNNKWRIWNPTTQQYEDTGNYVNWHVVKTYASIAAMNADYSGTDTAVGDYVMIVESGVESADNAKVYIKGSSEWEFVVDMSGATGIQGPIGVTPQFSIGTVEALSHGDDPTASVDNTDPTHPVLNLGIPAGASGNETIDDTAGLNDDDLVYSADKVFRELQKKADVIEETISTPASVMSFPDGADNLPMALTVGIDPVQDLHGYDNPWPAGGGKNLFDKYNFSVWTTVTVTQIDKGVTVAVATAGNNRYAVSNLPLSLLGKTITIHTDVSVSSTNYAKHALYFGDNSGLTSSIQVVNGTGSKTTTIEVPASLPEGSTRLLLVLYACTTGTTSVGTSATYDNLQIEIGSSATPYAPYSNICPISGWTGANVTRTGKNLTPIQPQKYNNNNCGILGIFLAQGTYTVSHSGGSCQYYIRFYTEGNSISNGTRISYSQDNQNSYTFDVPSDGYYTIQQYRSSDNSWASATLPYNMQVEKGPTATTYEPFGTTYSITFPSSAGTVYGGTLTVNKDGTGELVVNLKKVVFNGTENWARTTNAFYAAIDDDYLRESTVNGICDNYDFIGGVSGASSLTRNGCIAMFTGNADRIYVRDDRYTSAADFKANLVNNNVTVCYELATPLAYITFTATQVKTLLGVNNILADTGDILSVDYPADTKLYIDKKFAELSAAITALGT